MEINQFAPGDICPKRAFTHPAHTASDLRQIRYMLQRLSQVVHTLLTNQNPNRFDIQSHELIEPDGRHHRIIPIRPEKMMNAINLTVVGFFGQKNIYSDGVAIASRDKMLFDEMHKHPGLYSYSSLEMTNGDYGNCVLFADEEAKNNWGYSQIHTEAVDVLSPQFYTSIRLYNGIIPGQVHDFYRLKLHLVKYFDYSVKPTWLGARVLG